MKAINAAVLLSTPSVFAQNKEEAVDWLNRYHDSYMASKYYSYSSHPAHRGSGGCSGLASGALKQVIFDIDAIRLNQEADKTYTKAEISIQWKDIADILATEEANRIMIRSKKEPFIFLDINTRSRGFVVKVLKDMAIS